MPDKKPPKPAEPKYSPRKVKSAFIDVSPTSYVKESHDERLDQLVRFGLGDPGKMAFYRMALADPRSAVRDARLRDAAGDVLARLLDLVLADQNLFVRIKQLLQTRKSVMEAEDAIMAALKLRTEARDPEAEIHHNKAGRVRKKHPRKVDQA